MKDWKNWWYYHKWYVICGGILLWILIDITGSALGLWEKKPDFQIAYVGETYLSDDTVLALEQIFAELGGDFNRDGETIVRINQYVGGAPGSSPDMAFYGSPAEITLMGDISSRESYFFLTDDPENLQRDFRILADPDGSCPDESDYSIEDKVVLWTDCPILMDITPDFCSAGLTESEISGENQELLSGLYLGRRCFYSEKTVDYLSQCNDLWNKIINTENMQK